MSATYNADERWQEIKDTPLDCIKAVPYLEMIQMADSWDLPSNYACVVRSYNKEARTVTEKSFKSVKRACAYYEKLDEANHSVVTYDTSMMSSTDGFFEDDDES